MERLISNTVNLHFTDAIKGERRISRWIRCVSSVVVVDNVSTVVKTGDVDRIGYCGNCVVRVPKTQHSVLFICCVRYVYGESKKKWAENVASAWKGRNIFAKQHNLADRIPYSF